jgi:hypothetical protein
MRMNVPNNIEDFDSDDPDIEFRKKRQDYWNMIRKVLVKAIDEDLLENFDLANFSTHLERNYGLRIHIVDGMITDKFDIVDEKLYVLFLLKWK